VSEGGPSGETIVNFSLLKKSVYPQKYGKRVSGEEGRMTAVHMYTVPGCICTETGSGTLAVCTLYIRISVATV
jgi:hypothetical protein